MRALFLKDWYMAKSYCRSYLLIVVVFAAVSFVSSESLFFMAYPTIMFGILPVTLISYDERFHWPAYAGTLPLRRRDEVREKYLLSLLLIAVMGTVMTVLQAIAVLRSGSALAEGFVMMVVGMFVFSLIGPCVLLPLTYRFGSEKARVNFYILIVLVAVLIGTFSGMSTEARFPFKTVYLVLLAAVIACMPLSYVISCRAYEKREW